MLQTIQKIGPLLDLFTPDRPEWGVSEVAESIGMPRSSAHSLLASLVGTGLLQCRTRGRYRIGWRVVELGETLRASVDVRSVATGVLHDVVGQYGETMHLAVLERHKVLYVDKVLGNNVVNVIGARVGAHLDAHCSAVGKVLLAYRDPAEIARFVLDRPLRRLTPATITEPRALEKELAAIRSAGYGFDEGEAVGEVRCVAAPVRDELRSVVAAISLTAPASRLTARRAEYRRAVVSAAAEISRRMAATDGRRSLLSPVRDDPTALAETAS